MLRYFWVTKGVTVHIIGNVECGGDILVGYIVEEYELHVEASGWLYMLSVNDWIVENTRDLEYDTVLASLYEFESSLG